MLKISITKTKVLLLLNIKEYMRRHTKKVVESTLKEAKSGRSATPRSFGRLRNVARLIVRQQVFIHGLPEFVGGAVFEYLDKIMVGYRVRNFHMHPEFV